MTDPKDKRTLPAGSNGPLPIVVPSPSTQQRSAVTLSPPFDDAAATKGSPGIPKAPPMPPAAPGAAEPTPPQRSAVKTIVPAGTIKTPPHTPLALRASASPPSNPPSSTPADGPQPTLEYGIFMPVPSSPPVRLAEAPQPRDPMRTVPEVPHPQSRTVVIAPAPAPAPEPPRSRPKPPPPPAAIFDDLPPASTSAWPPADGHRPSATASDAPRIPPSIQPEPSDPDAIGPPALVPVRGAKDRMSGATRWAQRAWVRAGVLGRSAFDDGRRQFLSLGKGQRVAAIACVVGGLSIPVMGLALAIAARSAPPHPGASSARGSLPEGAPERGAAAPGDIPAASGEPKPRSASQCAAGGDPKRLAPRASKDVPVEVRIHSSLPSVAVGFAVDGGTAAGLVIDLARLEVVDRYRLGASRVTRVIPVEREGKFSFEVHGRGKGTLDDQSVLLPSGARALRWSRRAVSLADADGGSAEDVWKLEDRPDAVRVSSAGAAGTAVALRSREGIRIGWIDPDGKASGQLAALPDVTGKVGVPALAWNGHSLLVAFAHREPGEAGWGVKLAQAGPGKAATSLPAWKPPPGGPGGSAIAPSVAALPSGGWVLVWTEGEQGRREVRMQTLPADLAPIGEAQTVSGEGNAGQGVAAVGGARGIVLYLVGNRTHELWGRAIDCP